MRAAILTAISVLWGCSSLHAAPSGNSQSPAIVPVAATVGVEVVFSRDEIKIIRAYYESHGAHPGKGKRGYKSLPPGIAKNLRRGKPLPPGIAKQALPHDLIKRLPPPPKGYERIIVAGKVLLVEIATQIVRDMIADAVFS